MGSPANQYFPPAERKKIEKLVAESRNKAKQVIPGRPNPNIGMGLKTPSNLPQFGEPGWVNPNYDPYHNAAGYHRFDPTIPGMGLQMHKTYASGAASYDSYQKLTPGAGYAATSNQFLTENGINPATATDMQKFAAMDYAGRLGQWKNQRPKRKFGIKQAFGLAAQIVGAVYGGPAGAALGSAFSTGIQGGDLGDIAKSAAISGASAYAGGKIGDWAAQGTGGFNTVRSGVGPTLIPTGSRAVVAGSLTPTIGATLGRIGAQAAPYLSTAGQIAGTTGAAINQSGVTLTPTQYSNLQGGNPAVTTFEPENKNIAFSAHPTSAYLAAYPGAPESTATTASPITPTPAAPIAGTANAARPYVAPTRIPIAPNIPIINYDPRRNYQSPTTMQQALMRPAAIRRPSQNARTT